MAQTEPKPIELLLAILREIVEFDHRPWIDKKADILDSASTAEETALFEFLAWFDESDKEPADKPMEKAA